MLNVSKTTLMRSCDKNMTEKIGIPDAVLMENAANAVAQSIKKHTSLLPMQTPPNVTLFANVYINNNTTNSQIL